MKLKQILSFLVLVFFWKIQSVYAAPAPFGLELGKTTIQQMQKKYTTVPKGVNKYSHGKMFGLEPSELGVDGIQSALTIFDRNGKLVAMILDFPKTKFDDLYDSLRRKYKVVSSQIPFVGNKKVVMKDGDTVITLNAPHLSFKMELSYIKESLLRAFRKQTAQEEQAKKKREMNSL